MEVIIKGETEEIAALVLAVQGRQIVDTDAAIQRLVDGLSDALSSAHIPE